MTASITRPDVSKILGGLKDFQRETVDYVFRRLYTDADATHRFLLADEVGLGKTLIARGLVAKAVDQMWDEVPRIDVVYICSSGDIARQNVNKLNITGRKEWALASRVTMLPTQLRDIQARKVNFIAFTPGTTFKLASSGGQQNERVLMYSLLKSAWNIGGAAPKNLLQGYVQNSDRFRAEVDGFHHDSVDPFLRAKFAESLAAHNAKDAAAGLVPLRNRFEELCSRFGRSRTHVPKEDRKDQSRIIGELRSLLAATCIRSLEPDLVILDEFQRFKDLLTIGGEDEPEETQLARELFDYSEGSQKTRILLMSATPYKMYTTSEEGAGDDHYADFRQTLRFLHDDPTRSEKIERLLEEYRKGMFRLADQPDAMQRVRGEIETELRRIMVRTERLAASEDRNGMLREIPNPHLSLTAADAMSYRELHRVAKAVKHPETMEYWKAAPYALSFMDNYVLKQDVEAALEPDGDQEAKAAVQAARTLFLKKDDVEARHELQHPHARMRWLLDLCLGDDLWRLLWIPATAPYYQPSGQFAAVQGKSVTKRLLFSAWQVVPKAVAALVTYEAERRMFQAVARDGEPLTAIRDRLAPLLRFNRSAGRLTGLPVMGMIYPSFRLAELGDPLANRFESAEELVAAVESQLSEELKPVFAARPHDAAGAEDERWYWAAPALLDMAADKVAARAWLDRDGTAEAWSGAETRKRTSKATPEDEEGADASAWEDHVAALREALGFETFGRPPADLARVLAEFAVAGPAICALRGLSRGEPSSALRRVEIRDAAGQVAFAFRNLFNLPEARAILANGVEPYWRAVVQYAIDGNLQAVLDEYVHVLRDALGLFGQGGAEASLEIAAQIRNALSLRTARVSADELTAAGQLEAHNMRASYAVRFGDEADVDGKKANRKDLVRAAFNSPFWPFVLATTSVGQEGLDFHLYCHSVIHWNLPSNPVDLEQREGRVHRFKGHAVRKNVASSNALLSHPSDDPWSAAFGKAHAGRAPGRNDIVPFWVYPSEGGATIERHVPSLPMSRDEARLRHLKRSLALYRMVFGQPRQDELLGFLLTQFDEAQAREKLNELRIDLTPQTLYQFRF